MCTKVNVSVLLLRANGKSCLLRETWQTCGLRESETAFKGIYVLDVLCLTTIELYYFNVNTLVTKVSYSPFCIYGLLKNKYIFAIISTY